MPHAFHRNTGWFIAQARTWLVWRGLLARAVGLAPVLCSEDRRQGYKLPTLAYTPVVRGMLRTLAGHR